MTLYIQRDNILGKSFVWDKAKSVRLKVGRGIGFEDVLSALEAEGALWSTDHPHPDRYPGQGLFAVVIRDYVVVVPLEVKDETIELKTLYPNRKATREWRRSRLAHGSGKHE